VLALSKTSSQTVQIVTADLSAEVCQVTAVFLQSDTNVFIGSEVMKLKQVTRWYLKKTNETSKVNTHTVTSSNGDNSLFFN
jgi:hypothetical protein